MPGLPPGSSSSSSSSDSSSSSSSSPWQRTPRGSRARNLGDLIPIGFIKQYETNFSANDATGRGHIALDSEPKGSCEIKITNRFIPNEDFPSPQRFQTPIFEVTFSSVLDDMENLPVDPTTGIRAVEKIFHIYIDYSWLTDKQIEYNSVYTTVGFEVSGAGGTSSHVIHVYTHESHIPSLLNRNPFHSYMLVDTTIKFDVIPYFLAGDIEIVDNIIGPLYENLRFSEASIKLLPSRSLGLWLGVSGQVMLTPAAHSMSGQSAISGTNSSIGIAFMDMLIGSVVTGLGTPIDWPSFFKDFVIKFGYSVVGSSATYFNKEIIITKNDLFDVDGNKMFVEYDNCIVINKNIDQDADFISKLFGVFEIFFEFNDWEKKNIGNGIAPAGNPDIREGINQERIFEFLPLLCGVPKNKIITNLYTSQTRRYNDRMVISSELGTSVLGPTDGSPATSIPEERVPGNGGNIQIFLPKNGIVMSEAFEDKKVYVTYSSVRNTQFRQVCSFNIRASTSGGPNVDYKTFFQGRSYAYDTFYVKKSLKYKMKYLKIPIALNIERSGSNYIENAPPFFDSGSDQVDFRTPAMVNDISLGKLEESDFLSSAKAYRLSSRYIESGSERYVLSEGVFIASNLILNNGVTHNGIGYLDYWDNFTLLIHHSDIKDVKWWKNNFQSNKNVFITSDYLNGEPRHIIKYDRNVVCNSLFVDDEKIGYDLGLADALSTITKASDGGLGIGICMLDLISTKNFKVKRGFDFFLQYQPEVKTSKYVDLSEVVFSARIEPYWTTSISLSRPLTHNLGAAGPASIMAAFMTVNNLQPIDIGSQGRLLYEDASGLTGHHKSSDLWIKSNGYDIKVGFSSDRYKNIALYATQKDGFVRILHFNNADFMDFNISHNIGYIVDKKVIDEHKVSTNNSVNDIHWHGLPVDKVPFYQYGKIVVESENDKFFNIDNNNTVVYKNITCAYNKDSSSISFDKEYVISILTIKVKNIPAGKIQSKEASFFDYSLSFDQPLSDTLQSSTEAISFISFTKTVESDNAFSISSSVNIPNYQAQTIYLDGKIVDLLNSNDFAVTTTVLGYDVQVYDNVSFQSSDCYPAIDCFSQGYVVVVGKQDQTPSLDVYVTGDNDRRWSLFRNIFQSFVGDDIYQCTVKSDLKGTMIYIMFSLNGTLLCKPIEGWTIARLRYHLQKPEARNVFSLTSSMPGYGFYALSADIYDIIQKDTISALGIENEVRPFDDLDHFARIEPSYVVQGKFKDNSLLGDEYNSFVMCSQILSILNTSQTGNSQLLSVNLKINGIENNVSVVVPSSISKYKSGFSSRINFLNGFDQNRDPMDDWDVNQPYTFEVLSSGGIICFILKDGFIHIMESGDGKSWSQGLGLGLSYGFRPIKWSIDDSDCYINKESKQFHGGSCPPIENISSCYDEASGKITLFYVIGNVIFGQNFETQQIHSQLSDSMENLLQTRFSVLEDISRPYYIVGAISDSMIDNIVSNTNFVHFGIIQNNNPSSRLFLSQLILQISSSSLFRASLSELKTNGKAPGACYIGNGLIRLYYEDEKDMTRGVTIYENFVKIDLLNRSKSIDKSIDDNINE